MVTLMEHVLVGSLIVFLVLAIVLNLIILLLSAPGLMALFVTTFVVLRAAASGGTLLALDFLYPGAVYVAGLRELLMLVGVASLASVLLFDFGLEGLLLKALQRVGLSLPRIWGVETIVEGLVTDVMLVVAARLLTRFGPELLGTSEVGLSVGAALAAGLISAFVRYFLGLCLSDTNLGDEGFAEEAVWVEPERRNSDGAGSPPVYSLLAMFLILFLDLADGMLPVATEVLLGIASVLSAVVFVGLFTSKNYRYLALLVVVFLNLAIGLLPSRTWIDVASFTVLVAVLMSLV